MENRLVVAAVCTDISNLITTERKVAPLGCRVLWLTKTRGPKRNTHTTPMQQQGLFFWVFVMVYVSSWIAPGVVTSLAVTHAILSDPHIQGHLDNCYTFMKDVGFPQFIQAITSDKAAPS